MDVILVCVVMATAIAAIFYLVVRKDKPHLPTNRVYPRDPIARREAKTAELKQRLGLTKRASSTSSPSRQAEPDATQSSAMAFFEAADYTTSTSSSSSSYAEAPDTSYSDHGSSYGGDSYGGGDCGGGSDGGGCGGD